VTLRLGKPGPITCLREARRPEPDAAPPWTLNWFKDVR
jgi:hypothetical protein